MGIEKWVAVVSLALFVMFIGLMITIYNFMTDVPVWMKNCPVIALEE